MTSTEEVSQILIGLLNLGFFFLLGLFLLFGLLFFRSLLLFFLAFTCSRGYWSTGSDSLVAFSD
jgi:hypothetical protein